MNELPYAQKFQDLIVYQKAYNLANQIYELTKSFPKNEAYSLTDQIRRSSRSIGAQIAEAWAKRKYPKNFISKLTDADGEQQETQHWIGIAANCGYWDQKTSRELLEYCQEIGRLLGGIIAKADLFCSSSPHTVREPLSAYFTNQNDESSS